MAFGDKIQSVSANNTGVTSITVNFSAATAGNLLIVAVGNSAPQTWGTAPSGWSLIAQVTDAAGNMSGIWYYKIAAGGETSVVVTFDNLGSNVRAAMAEYEGPFTATPLDQTAESEANISSTTTSQTSGTTGTTSQADELLLAFFAGDTIQNIDAGRAYTNSFSEDECETSPGGRAAAILARLVVSAISTYTTTFSTTDTGDEMYGSIGTFKKSTSGTTYNQSAAGAITMAGAVTRQINKALAGAITMAGAITRQTNKALAGAITMAGAVATVRQFLQALAGAITMAGSLLAELIAGDGVAASQPLTLAIRNNILTLTENRTANLTLHSRSVFLTLEV